MAYFHHYTITFQSRITENIRVELHKKDVEPIEVVNLTAISLERSYPKGDGNKFDNIIGQEVKLVLLLRRNDTPEFYDFFVTHNDEWKIFLYSDEQLEFVGFLTPGEGEAEFQNKPYEITLNATDGLGLLKGVKLTDVNGNDFEGINLMKDYYAAIFSKTGLDLPIRMYSSWIEESMVGRLTIPSADTFSQAGLHKRTFLNNTYEFLDCYECLKRLTEKGFIVYQWSAMWVVLNVGEMQAAPGPLSWYTDYDSSGTVTGSGQLSSAPCPIGLDKIIHPTNRTHTIGSMLSVKSVRTNFNFIPPPELVNNQDLSRLGSFISPLSGVSHRAYQVVGWSHRQGNLSAAAAYSGSKNAYIRTEIDAFGNEVFRYYRIESDTSAPGAVQNYIQNDNDDFWVEENDRMDVSFTWRATATNLANQDIGIVALLRDGQPGTSPTDWYTLSEDGEWVNNDTTVALEQPAASLSNRWKTTDIECDPFPEAGNLYFLLGTGNGVGPIEYDYKAVVINYKPFFSEPIRTFIFNFPFLQALPTVITNPNDTAPKGDSWFTEQNVMLNDKIDEEVFISDSNRKSIRGALFRGTTPVLTTPTWHRDNVSEERHFKELMNMSRFNHAYRRMYLSRGVFSGLKWQPADDSTVFEPLGFHRHFFFPDKSALSGKYFMLVPPVVINHSAGTFSGNFVECLDAALVEGESGVTPEQVAYQLALSINQTTEAEWDSAGGAPSPGTAHFPPIAVAIGNRVIIYSNSANTLSGSASDGGAGNSPSLTLNFSVVIFSQRQSQFTVGPDVQPGNTFTITIYGHDVTFTSSSVTEYQDGNQLGDVHSYSILFK